jgi:dihydrofolate synthase/folylpolyglutamate synthase
MEVKSYNDALTWLHSFIDTERSGQFITRREDLLHERTLLKNLGNPQQKYGITHIAGTKGKGSTSVMVNDILLAANVRVGLYTQPKLHTIREQIRINRRPIAETELVQLIPLMQESLSRVDPSLGAYITFEIASALAFLYFHQRNVDHAVIEVGLGGRLDPTNVVEPMMTAITSISYDHTHVLGNTLTEIAREKAGIIKPGVPVICSAQALEAVETIKRISIERASSFIQVGPAGALGCSYTYKPINADSKRQWFHVTTPKGVYKDLELGLLGEHQVENATVAIAVAEHLCDLGLPINEASIRQGLKEARWTGRLQVVGLAPLIIVDGAHNADSFGKLFGALRRHFSFQRLILLLGMMADKDLRGIVEEIKYSGVDRIVVTAASHPRVMAPDIIAAHLTSTIPQIAGQISVSLDIPSALHATLNDAGPNDLVCVTGSLYVVAEALQWLASYPATLPDSIEIVGIDPHK